jgi:hypothetical protein
MKNLFTIIASTLFVNMLIFGCGPNESQNEGLDDESLKSELEGKAFGNWKTVMVQFKVDGVYEAYLKSSESAYDKHSAGEGTWEVQNGKITLSPNDSQSETVQRVKGVYTYNGECIESATHRLEAF